MSSNCPHFMPPIVPHSIKLLSLSLSPNSSSPSPYSVPPRDPLVLEIPNPNFLRNFLGMESSKHMKSNSGSSEESDHHREQVKDDAGSTAKRSYECTYCKRGFTNAQALGGHMNIHRKDRAKAKKNPNSSVSKTPNEDYMMSSGSYFRPMISGEHANYYHPSMVSCPTYHPLPQPLYNEGDFSSHRSSNIFNLDDTRVGANLSLRIGSSYMDHREVIMRVDDQENDDVDLELRLGPDP